MVKLHINRALFKRHFRFLDISIYHYTWINGVVYKNDETCICKKDKILEHTFVQTTKLMTYIEQKKGACV